MRKFFENGLTMPRKTEKGDLLGFFNIHYVGKYQKIEGVTLQWKSFSSEKKSHRAEKTEKGDPLAPLSFLDDVKILLRKLSKNYKL